MRDAGHREGKPKIFIVYGMPRTGTTYLYHALSKHPEIFVPYRKESHYFSVNYSKGQAWFASLYDGVPSDRIAADINPMYYLDPLADDRVLAYDPDVKVVLGVREPTDFAISLYGNMLAHGHDVPPITEVVRDYDWPLTPQESLRFSLGDGFLQRRVEQLRARFGANLMLYDFAHFDASPLPVMQAIERLLGLQPWFDESNHQNVRINASGRRNPFLLNTLLANQRVLDVLYAIVPKAIVRQARRTYERLSARAPEARPPAGEGKGAVDAATRQALDAYFADDARYYRALFTDGPVLMHAARPPA